MRSGRALSRIGLALVSSSRLIKDFLLFGSRMASLKSIMCAARNSFMSHNRDMPGLIFIDWYESPSRM